MNPTITTTSALIIGAIALLVIALRVRAVYLEHQARAEHTRNEQARHAAALAADKKLWITIEPTSRLKDGEPDWRIRLPGQSTLIRATAGQHRQAETLGLERTIADH